MGSCLGELGSRIGGYMMSIKLDDGATAARATEIRARYKGFGVVAVRASAGG